jgi:ABC-type glutathione transport system ATPase component
MTPAVELRDVGRAFHQRGVTRSALDGVSFSLEPGSVLAIVGESGAGKSTLTRLIAGLDSPSTGEVLINGEHARVKSGRPAAVQMVFQNPVDALNPYWSIGRSIAEPLGGRSRAGRRTRLIELMEAVGLDPDRVKDRPGRFSGGQLQRVGLARALAAKPRVLLCDEPTSALDVSVQAQIVNLLLRLQQDEGFSCIVVTHDLSVVRVLAERVIVLRDGHLVEDVSADQFFENPRHEYSRLLIDTMANAG